MNLKKHIPNFITLINLFLGCCAVASVLYGQFVQAFWFFMASGVADFLDGTFARVLKVGSPIGKQLDSLADMVSFGVVPGAVLYMLLVKGYSGSDVLPIELTIAASPAFIVTLFAAIRLANFNIDERQTVDFIGLNTPSCAMFVMGLLLIHQFDSFGYGWLVTEPIFLYVIIPVLSWLMVAEFPMFSLKIKNFGWQGNEFKLSLLFLTILFFAFFREAAISMVILAYIVLSFVKNKFSRA